MPKALYIDPNGQPVYAGDIVTSNSHSFRLGGYDIFTGIALGKVACGLLITPQYPALGTGTATVFYAYYRKVMPK